MSDRLECIILVGVPAGGKSEWTKQFLSSGKKYVVVSTDDIIEKEAECTGKKYNDLWQSMIRDAEKQSKALYRDSIKNKRNIIVDRTNLFVNKRKGLLSQLSKDYYKIAVYFDTADEVQKKRLKTRAEKTGKDIPEDVVERMKKELEVPTVEEGFDEVQIVFAGNENEIEI